MERISSPPAGDRALTALDAGLRTAPKEKGAVPIQALGWWMWHWSVGPTRVRDAVRDDLAARRFPLRAEVPERPGRGADDVEVALGGFPATSDEWDFVTRLLRARDKPTGPVPERAEPASHYGLGSRY